MYLLRHLCQITTKHKPITRREVVLSCCFSRHQRTYPSLTNYSVTTIASTMNIQLPSNSNPNTKSMTHRSNYRSTVLHLIPLTHQLSTPGSTLCLHRQHSLAYTAQLQRHNFTLTLPSTPPLVDYAKLAPYLQTEKVMSGLPQPPTK